MISDQNCYILIDFNGILGLIWEMRWGLIWETFFGGLPWEIFLGEMTWDTFSSFFASLRRPSAKNPGGKLPEILKVHFGLKMTAFWAMPWSAQHSSSLFWLTLYFARAFVVMCPTCISHNFATLFLAEGIIFGKVLFCWKCWFSLKHSFCINRLHMAALGEVLEAKCSYFDVLSFRCSPHPAQNIALYLKIVVFGALFLKKHFFMLSLPWNNSS